VGVDVIRYARGDEQMVGAPLDPFTDMLACKLCELVFESMRAAIVQAILLVSGVWTPLAVLSISCLSTALTSKMMAYDIDTGAKRWHKHPEFYG
jgi:hypothetical protein